MSDKSQLITEPGKFEGEPTWVPEWWDLGMHGCADEDVNGVWKFYLGDEDREANPDFADYNTLYLWEDDQGFVHHDLDWRTDHGR